MAPRTAFDIAREDRYARLRTADSDDPPPEAERQVSSTRRPIMLNLLRLSALLLAIYTAFLFLRAPTVASGHLEYDDNAIYTDEEARLLLEMHLRSYDPYAYRKTASKSWWPAWKTICAMVYDIIFSIFNFVVTVVILIPALWVLNNTFWPKQWYGRLPELPGSYSLLIRWFFASLRRGSSQLYTLTASLLTRLAIHVGLALIIGIMRTSDWVSARLRPIDIALDRLRDNFRRRFFAVNIANNAGLAKKYLHYLRTGVLRWIAECLLISACMACTVLAIKYVSNLSHSTPPRHTVQATRTSQMLPTKTARPWLAPSYTLDGQDELSTALITSAADPWSGGPMSTSMVPVIPDSSQASLDRAYRSYRSKMMNDPELFESVWEAALRGEPISMRPTTSTSTATDTPTVSTSSVPLTASPVVTPQESSPRPGYKAVLASLIYRITSTLSESAIASPMASSTPGPASSSYETSHRSTTTHNSRDPLVGVDIDDLTLAEMAELTGPMHLAPTGRYTKSLLAEPDHAYCDLCRQRHGFEVMVAQKEFMYEWQMGL